jgi:hypothetical protein
MLLLLLPVLSAALPLRQPTAAQRYAVENDFINGVNLGGLFVQGKAIPVGTAVGPRVRNRLGHWQRVAAVWGSGLLE